MSAVSVAYLCLALLFAAKAKCRYFTTWNYYVHCCLLLLAAAGIENITVWAAHGLTCGAVFIGSHFVMAVSSTPIVDRFTRKWYMLPVHIVMHILPAFVCWDRAYVSLVTIALFVLQCVVYQRIYGFDVVYGVDVVVVVVPSAQVQAQEWFERGDCVAPAEVTNLM
jgi:hypothetical protein